MEENTSQTATNELSPGLLSLPMEILLLIIEMAASRGSGAAALLELMLVCRAFVAPASLLLHKSLRLRKKAQAEGLLESLKRAPSPARLASSTKSLSISYRSDSNVVEGEVSTTTALPILFLLDNLRYLDVDAGDEGLKAVRQVLASGGGGMSKLRGLKSSKVRWDKLVGMLANTHKLARLDIEGLHQAEPAGEDAEQDDEDAPPTEAGSSSPPATTTHLGDDEEEGVLLFRPELARPPSPSLPAPLVLPPFPASPLTRLVLRSPNIADELLLSILSASYKTLSSLALIEAHCFSRTALVVALKGVRNLSDLELSACRFPPGDDAQFAPAVAARPANSPPNALTPLPSLVLSPTDPPFRLSTPLPAPFSSDTARLTPSELAFPLDHLPRLLPFLHVLTLSSDDLLSADPAGRGGDALASVVGALPLQYLTLDIARPRIGVDELVEAVKRAEGRIDAVAVGKRMRWTQRMLDEGKTACAEMGVLLGGDVVEERLRW
ncbi:hypothetical protein JCM6882_002618 [Rhodosporidiobolus microsporus]